MDIVGRKQKEIFYSLLLFFILLINSEFSMKMDCNTVVSESGMQGYWEMQYN